MLREVFRTKEKKIIIVILSLAVIILSIIAFTGYSQNKLFAEQAVMAENYLKAGSYEQAIEFYLKALSMENNDEQFLTIGLAEAYAGTNDYNKALEVLRSCYQKTSGIGIKEKIEEITIEKMDFDYLQSISHAEIYFTNQEYEKAISEFEKAKQIKSKEATSYQRIAEAYIELGEFDLAREEILEGQAITQDKSLVVTLAVIDSYRKKEQYDTLIAQAAEYILQENYDDGIAQYEEAIALIPEENAAYSELAKIYISRKDYEKAVKLLEQSVGLTDSNELKDLLNQASELKDLEIDTGNLLSSLYHAFEKRNITVVTQVMDLALFKEDVVQDTPVFYNEGIGDESDGLSMIIYDSKKIYYGDIRDGMKNGIGIYFLRTDTSTDTGYYYYDGKWDKDIPDGRGKTVEESVSRDDKGQKSVLKTVTEGIFKKGFEDGNMNKYFYIKEEETGRMAYSAKDGVPLPLSELNCQPPPAPEAGSYIIGILTLDGKPTGEYYSVEEKTIWGVLPFIAGSLLQ